MTDAQIKMTGLREEARANKARETENYRSNRAKEKETIRSNKEKERLTRRGQNVNAATSLTGTVVKALPVVAGLMNDPKFYTTGNESIIGGIVPTQFSNPLQASIQLGDGNKETGYNVPTPGVMNIMLQNGVGSALTVRSAVNKASSMLFTKIQEHTSYTKPYQPVDAMMMILAEREIVGLMHHAAKIIRIAKHATFDNAYNPRYVIETMRIDYDDLRNNYANYKKRLHLIAVEAGQLRIPKIPLMDRTAQIYGSWFKDDDISEEKTPTYTFSPASYGVFTISSGDVAAGFIRFKPFSTHFSDTITFKVLLDAIDECVEAILQDTNFKFISGDLGRTFDSFFDIQDLNLEAVQIPYYEKYSLDQIHNANTIMSNSSGYPLPTLNYAEDDVMTSSPWNIQQDEDGLGIVKYWPSYSLIVASGISQSALTSMTNGVNITDLAWDNPPSTDSVIDATRLKSFWTWAVDGTTATAYAGTFGTEIPIRMDIGAFGVNTSNIEDFRVNPATSHYLDGDSSVVWNRLGHMFTHSPIVYNYTLSAGAWFRTILINSKLNNYRAFKAVDYEYMNDAALYSLFGLTKELKF